MPGKSLRDAHSADTRHALIRAARRSFNQRGYAATSLDDVCRLARLTKGALYHHFDNKEDLFRAVLEQVESEFVRAGASAADPAAEIWTRLQAAAVSFLDACAASNSRRIVLEAPAVLGWQACRDLEARYVVNRLGTALETAAADEIVRTDQPKLLAHLLVALLNEAAMMVAEADDPRTARAAVVKELNTILDGLRLATSASAESVAVEADD